MAGIPRMLRPRKRFGTVRGFSVVDVGGNWLRVHTSGSVEDAEAVGGLAQQIVVAARLADAHGDDALALKTLENGLARYQDADAPAQSARTRLLRGSCAPGGTYDRAWPRARLLPPVHVLQWRAPGSVASPMRLT